MFEVTAKTSQFFILSRLRLPALNMTATHLINWSHLPVDSLDGVSSSEYSFIAELSSDNHRDDNQLEDFINFITDHSRSDDELLGVDLPECEEDGASVATDVMDKAEVDSLPRSTKEQMFLYGKAFASYMSDLGHPVESLKTMEPSSLNEHLRFYYFRLSKPNGESYSPSSLVCIRAGIQRFFHFIIKRELNIVDDPNFATANRMLRVKVRDFHSKGGSVKRYEPIERADLTKLSSYFDRSTGERLQDEVIYTLLYVLGERGQEHLQHLRQRDILVEKEDGDGKKYYELPNLRTKNQSANPVKAKGFNPKQARIYGGQYELIKTYLQVLPNETKDNSFFPRPMANKEGQLQFSTKQVRGINWLGSFMTRLSTLCELSKKYTNHCIRVTRTADLHEAGYTLSDIMNITGQQSESTVRRYLSRKRDHTLRDMATTVGEALQSSDSRTNTELVRTDQPSNAGSSSTMDVSNQNITLSRQNVSTIFTDCHFSGCTFNLNG